MPTFGRTGTGKWHVVGSDGCRYGQAFADDPDSTPDETVTATDIVSYTPPDLEEEEQSSSIAVALSHSPRSSTRLQQLVLPSAIADSDAGLCGSCRSRLETQKRRRSRLIGELKRVTPAREIDWTKTEPETLSVCYWCRAHESELWQSDALECRVCPACGRLYNSPLGEPGPEDAPDRDRRPETPTDPVAPIVFGAALPEYDPTELVGSNRPMITVREKTKYATLKFDLERTGHAFTPDAIDALEAVRATYAEQVAGDESHQAEVRLDVGTTARSVTLEGLYPDDVAAVIADCWDVVSDPANWFPLGWPQQGRIYVHSMGESIPGDDPVVETFPRLKTQAPATSVDTESLRRVTESGRYQRGERYYNRGAVTDIERADDRLQATVQGTRPYNVVVTLDGGRYVDGECSCPDDAVPCKHIVAAVLASGDVEPTAEEHSLEELISNASRGELETLLVETADDDLRLRRRFYDELQS